MKIAKQIRSSKCGEFLMSNKSVAKFLNGIYNFFHNRSIYKSNNKNAIKINRLLIPILRKYSGFLGCGAALTLSRDRKLPKNQDLDYLIFSQNTEDLIKDLQNLNFTILENKTFKNKPVHILIEKYGALIDIFLCEIINSKFYIYTIGCKSYKIDASFKNNKMVTNDLICYRRTMNEVGISEEIINENIFLLPQKRDVFFYRFIRFRLDDT